MMFDRTEENVDDIKRNLSCFARDGKIINYCATILVLEFFGNLE